MAPPPLSLGGGFASPGGPVVGSGRGGGGFLISTASEAQYLDDHTAATLAAELAAAREAREAGRPASARSSQGGSPLGPGAAAGGRGLRVSLDAPASPLADEVAEGHFSAGSGGSGLSPIREGVPTDGPPDRRTGRPANQQR